ncbi:Auxin responsive SAUR protein [Cynara cardunculus var. scolymus]|uniref:Auxin responsive SAUR protein n=1 Tax=Cynara cardunculus var. scolymus TaxID=59895 RepID=A0A103SH35_CYNCS|nr:Auxin responsive SAUR protein [Cynara cardunculus var. scolymus]
MGIHKFSKIVYAKLGMPRYYSSSAVHDVPKGYCSVYVGESSMKRFVIPLTYLNHPSFQTLLNLAEEEFGYAHRMGGLTFPCKEETFIKLASDIDLTS